MRNRVWRCVESRGASVLSAGGLMAGLVFLALFVGLLARAPMAAATPRAVGGPVAVPEGSAGLGRIANPKSGQRGFDVYYRQGDGHVLAWFSLRDGNQIPRTSRQVTRRLTIGIFKRQ